MAKLCPQCKKENPSSAKYCMHCPTQLVSDEELSTEDKLQKELKDANEIISLQTKHLQTLENQLKKHDDDAKLLAQSQIAAEKEKYEQQIAEKNNQNENLILQLEEEKKRNSKSNWGWIFLVLFVILLFLFVKVYSDKENKNSRISELEYKIEQLENNNKELVTLKVENEKLEIIKHENQKLKNENEKLLMQITQLKDSNF